MGKAEKQDQTYNNFIHDYLRGLPTDREWVIFSDEGCDVQDLAHKTVYWGICEEQKLKGYAHTSENAFRIP
jgi:hypothetical protein